MLGQNSSGKGLLVKHFVEKGVTGQVMRLDFLLEYAALVKLSTRVGLLDKNICNKCEELCIFW